MCLRRNKTINSNETKDLKVKIDIFSIPAGGNSITETDIRNGHVRITQDNKRYFPDYDCIVNIMVGNREFKCRFRLGNNRDKARSHFLKLGHEVIKLLGVETGGYLTVQKLDEISYNMEKQT